MVQPNYQLSDYCIDSIYVNLCEKILREGTWRKNRTGIDTIDLFGPKLEYEFYAHDNSIDNGNLNLTIDFPLLSLKKIFFKGVIQELFWFLRGETNIKPLTDAGVHIWDEWADEKGDLGRVYGAQWRSFGQNGFDQIATLIKNLRTNPDSRRHIVSAWNAEEVETGQMALPPCHVMFQVNVEGEFLDLQMYQRSADMFLGVPFNIASYALLQCLLAADLGLKPRKFHHVFGSAHIYENHLMQVHEMIRRHRHSTELPQPEIVVPKKPIFDDSGNILITPEDVILTDYEPMPAIKGEVAV